MILPPNPHTDIEAIESRLKNQYFSVYDTYCDLSGKKINIWEALIIAYNLGRDLEIKKGGVILVSPIEAISTEEFLLRENK